MEEQIESTVRPAEVWRAWERAYGLTSSDGTGQIREKDRIRYEIFNVKQGECFSILWKTFLVRLIFSHSVLPIDKGSKIVYKVQIQGLFAWPIKFLIGSKIQKNMRHVLRSFGKSLYP